MTQHMSLQVVLTATRVTTHSALIRLHPLMDPHVLLHLSVPRPPLEDLWTVRTAIHLTFTCNKNSCDDYIVDDGRKAVTMMGGNL